MKYNNDWNEQYLFFKDLIIFNLELIDEIKLRNINKVQEMLTVTSEFITSIQAIVNEDIYIEQYPFFKAFGEFCNSICKINVLETQISNETWMSLLNAQNYFTQCLMSIRIIIKENNTEELRECICCKNKVIYQALPEYYEYMNRKNDVTEQFFETLNKEDYNCPKCGSSDRDRLIIMFLDKIKQEDGKVPGKVLQLAPARTIENWINREYPNSEYHSMDLYMDGVTFKADIQNMNMIQDNCYDLFICSHVLEHVQDDRKAMKELWRILKKDGIGIFLVPLRLDADKIDEEWGLSESENWRRFDQGDHCRRYAKEELVERLEEAGFTVHCLYKDYFGDSFYQNGLTPTSCLYVLTKDKLCGGKSL